MAVPGRVKLAGLVYKSLTKALTWSQDPPHPGEGALCPASPCWDLRPLRIPHYMGPHRLWSQRHLPSSPSLTSCLLTTSASYLTSKSHIPLCKSVLWAIQVGDLLGDHL